MADGVGIAPTQTAGSLGFRDRGITALPTILKMFRVERIALPSSSFQARPSAIDITPSSDARGRSLAFIFDVRSIALYYFELREQ